MTLARRARYAALLLRVAAGFALLVEASVVRFSLRFAAESATLMQAATAAQIGGGLLLIFGIFTRWVAPAAFAAVALTLWLLPADMAPMALLWMAALAAVVLLEARQKRGAEDLPTWRHIAGLARAEIFK